MRHLQVLGFVLTLTAFRGAVLPADTISPLIFVEGFRRGDVNDDMLVDTTDAITILKYIFVGDADPSCQDKADVNDDGVLDIMDPINLLSFTYLGTDPIPEPFDPYGPDPTEDDLSPCGVLFPLPFEEGLPPEPEVIWPVQDRPSPAPCWSPWGPCI